LVATEVKERYHALDSMRAVMMLLGVVLHAAIPYATYTLGVFSAYHDVNDSYILSSVTLLIHLFRMPAFFLVAGFFGAMLFQKRGPAGMLRDRAKRILVPLCIGWIILFPLTILGAAFTVLGGPKGVSTVIHQLQSGAVLKKNNMTFADLFNQIGLIHLWFLYYLIIFYLVVVSFLTVTTSAKRLRLSISGSFSSLIKYPLGLLVFAAITWLTMYDMPPATVLRAGFENSNNLTPHLPAVLANLVFFVFGWLLFKQKHLLLTFGNRLWFNLFVGLGLSALYAYWVINPPAQHAHLIQITVASLAIWLLVLAVMGIFIRYAGKPNRIARYLADASYWIYLVHLPLTLFLPGFLIDIALPGLVKFLLVFSASFFISVFTYHYFVRATFIGKALNGRRYPRSLPVNEPLPGK
jgi:glucan biosynthesis protein C